MLPKGGGWRRSVAFPLCEAFSRRQLWKQAPGYFCLGDTGEDVKVVPTSVF